MVSKDVVASYNVLYSSEQYYSEAKPKRFASRVDKNHLVVALDPAVAEVFTSPEAVNRILRALIQTMPATSRRRARP